MLEAQLLSKVLDEDKFYELARYNVSDSDFPTYAPVYEFIRDYVKDNGKSPDYRTVSGNFPEFDYYPEVTDGYKYLASQIKSQSAKRQAFNLLQIEAKENFKTMSGTKFAKWLRESAEQIERQSDLSHDFGINFATSGQDRLTWYRDVKANRSNVFIPTPYESLNNALGGGVEISDYVLLMAFTNRGKSWIASHLGLSAWEHGFGVAHYSPELSQRQQLLRLDTLKGHFDNVKLRRGSLENEEKYTAYLDQFAPDKQETPYIVKTMEDLPHGLTLDVIEADLQMNPNIRMVIIDGFNLMVHGSGKNRDVMTRTSRALRQLFGKYKVAGIVVHQTTASAEKENKGKKEDEKVRLVRPPKLTDYSETIASIQDAATVLTFDQAEGIGKISIEKAREPSVGTVIELSCNFNLGYISEQDVTSMF